MVQYYRTSFRKLKCRPRGVKGSGSLLSIALPERVALVTVDPESIPEDPAWPETSGPGYPARLGTAVTVRSVRGQGPAMRVLSSVVSSTPDASTRTRRLTRPPVGPLISLTRAPRRTASARAIRRAFSAVESTLVDSPWETRITPGSVEPEKRLREQLERGSVQGLADIPAVRVFRNGPPSSGGSGSPCSTRRLPTRATPEVSACLPKSRMVQCSRLHS